MINKLIKNKIFSERKVSIFAMCISTCSWLNTEPCFSMMRTHDNDDLSSRPTKRQCIRSAGKVAKSPLAANEDTIINLPRFNAALSQEEERQHDLANYNYHLAFGEQSNKDFCRSSTVSSAAESSSDEDSPGSSSGSSLEDESVEENDSNGEEEVKELYKLAKANIEEEDIDTAIENFEDVISMGDQTNYFGKAHYQLGMILMATDKTLETAHHLRTAAKAGYGPACARYGFYTLRVAGMDPKRKTMRANALRFLDTAKEDPKGAYTLGLMYKDEKTTRSLEFHKNQLKILESYKEKMENADEKEAAIIMRKINEKEEILKIKFRRQEYTPQNKANIREAEELLKFAEQNLTNESKSATAAYHVADIILDKIKEHPSITIDDDEFNTYLQKAAATEELVEQVEALESAFEKIQDKRQNFKTVQETRQNKGWFGFLG